MVDSTTAYYTLILPEVGASQDTWGGKYNTNTNSIDSALHGLQVSKADLAGPAFSGNATFSTATFTGAVTFSGTVAHAAAVTAPTPAAADNSTNVATTAWATTAINARTPAGAIMAFGMPTPPAGWLECNGVSLLRTTYPALFAAIGGTWGAVDGTHFSLPDFRGFFLRGWAHGSGNDITLPTRAFASFQEFSNQDHLHGNTASASTSIAAAGSHAHNVLGQQYPFSWAGPGAPYNVMGYNQVANVTVTDAAGNHAHTATTTVTISNAAQDRTGGFAETKPRNFAVLYCIRT